jgi:hypothetical protein
VAPPTTATSTTSTTTPGTRPATPVQTQANFAG